MSTHTFVRKIELSGWKGNDRIEHMVEIVVDVDGLAFTLGNKAYRNKSKKAKEAGGLISVSVRPTQAAIAKQGGQQ